MTRDEYLIHIYGQRRKVLGWLRRQGVPTVDAEKIVDQAFEFGLRRFDRGKVFKSLAVLATGYLQNYRRIAGKVVPRGDLERLENALEQQKRGRTKHDPAE